MNRERGGGRGELGGKDSSVFARSDPLVCAGEGGGKRVGEFRETKGES